MYTLNTLPLLLFLLPLLTSALPASSACTPSSSTPIDIPAFSLTVDGSSEGQPEQLVAWSTPGFPESPGAFILSATPMTGPLLTFLNGNAGGKLCNEGDLCSDLDVPSGPDNFQGVSFNGEDQNAKPAFAVVGICDSEGLPVYKLVPRADSGYESFAVTSFAFGSEIMLRKKGQVGVGSDVTLKIVRH